MDNDVNDEISQSQTQASKRSQLMVIIGGVALVAILIGSFLLFQQQQTTMKALRLEFTETENTLRTELVNMETKLAASEEQQQVAIAKIIVLNQEILSLKEPEDVTENESIEDSESATVVSVTQESAKSAVQEVLDEVVISSPKLGDAWCLGSSKHILWNAPAEWDVAKILVQNISGGNEHVDTVPAQDDIYVWTVGNTKNLAGTTNVLLAGQYKIVITWENNLYQENHRTSSKFSIINC